MQLARPITRTPNSTRGGFTLIELIVVIVIVGILAALLLPAIQGAFTKAKVTQVVVEIKGLESAITSFKLKYGVEPPSKVSIYTTQAGWDSDPTSKATIRRMWNEFDFSMPTGSFPTWWSDIKDSKGNKGILNLNSGECLVFFLGGVQQTGGTSGFGTPTGFSANKARPFSPDSGSRLPPFFEFDFGRFTDIDDNGLPEYADILPGKNKKPYLYFSSYEGSGYRVAAGESELPSLSGIVFSDVYRQATTSGLVPGVKTFGLPAQKPQTFQIISPGYDGEYGAGGVYNTELPDGGLIGLDGKPDKDAFDNITNFSGGTLKQ